MSAESLSLLPIDVMKQRWVFGTNLVFRGVLDDCSPVNGACKVIYRLEC